MPTYQDLSFVKYMEIDTALRDETEDGFRFVARASADDPDPALLIDLTDVLISSYQTGGSGGDDRYAEDPSLDFMMIEADYG